MALSDLKITGIFESFNLRALCLLWDIVPAKFFCLRPDFSYWISIGKSPSAGLSWCESSFVTTWAGSYLSKNKTLDGKKHPEAEISLGKAGVVAH